MKVESFKYNFSEDPKLADGKAATKFVSELLEHYLSKGSHTDFENIMDAVQMTKQQGVASGLLQSLDGKLKWQMEAANPLVSSGVRGVWDKLPKWVQDKCPQSLIDKVCSASPTASFELPDKMRSLSLEAQATPVKRQFSVSSTVDSNNQICTQLKGVKPFLFGSRWRGECTLSAVKFGSLPGLEASFTRPIFPSLKKTAANDGRLPELEKLTIAGGIREHASHLSYLLSEHLVSLRATYAKSSMSSYHFALEKYEAAKRTSLYLRRIPCDGLSVQERLYASMGMHRSKVIQKGRFRFRWDGTATLSTPIRQEDGVSETLNEVAMLGQVDWPFHNGLEGRFRAYVGGVGYPFGHLRDREECEALSVTDIPLYKRLFMGGPQQMGLRTPLRGLRSDRVGGYIVPPMSSPIASSTLSEARESTEHMGGQFAVGTSLEVLFPSIYDLARSPTLHKSRTLSMLMKRLKPKAFVDSGLLLPSLPRRAADLVDSLTVTSGFGLSGHVMPGVRLETSWGWPHVSVAYSRPTVFQLGVHTEG